MEQTTTQSVYVRITRADYNALLAKAELYDECLARYHALETQFEQLTINFAQLSAQVAQPGPGPGPGPQPQPQPQASTQISQLRTNEEVYTHPNPAAFGGGVLSGSARGEAHAHANADARTDARTVHADGEAAPSTVPNGGQQQAEPESIVSGLASAELKSVDHRVRQAQTAEEAAALSRDSLTPAHLQTGMRYGELFKQACAVYERVHGRAHNVALMTPSLVNVVCYSVEMGMRAHIAAVSAGVPRRTWNWWRDQAARGNEPYAAMFDLIDMAEARLEGRVTAAWLRHTVTDWRAAQAFLARRVKQDWQDATTPQTINVEQLAQMTNDELAKIVGPALVAQLVQSGDAENIIDAVPVALDDRSDV